MKYNRNSKNRLLLTLMHCATVQACSPLECSSPILRPCLQHLQAFLSRSVSDREPRPRLKLPFRDKHVPASSGSFPTHPAAHSHSRPTSPGKRSHRRSRLTTSKDDLRTDPFPGHPVLDLVLFLGCLLPFPNFKFFHLNSCPPTEGKEDSKQVGRSWA